MNKHLWFLLIPALLALSTPALAQNTVVPLESGPTLQLPAPVPPASLELQNRHTLEWVRALPNSPQIEVRLPKDWPSEKIKFVVNQSVLDSSQAKRQKDTWLIDVPLNQALRIQAHHGEQIAELQLDTRQLAPGALSLSVPSNTVVAHQLKFLAVTSIQALSTTPEQAKTSAELDVLLDGKKVYQGSWQPSVMQLLPALPVALGKHQLQVVAHNVWGTSKSPPVQIFNLGVDMPASTYVLVDKYNFNLYYVKDNMMQRIYPIATGTPRTPTPTGYFIIGKKELMPNPYTSWGVVRLLIYRQEAYAQRHWSGYAIHGTNNPSSIGREASHGCMRLFNENVTVLSHEIPMGTLLLIKNKIDTYISEL